MPANTQTQQQMIRQTMIYPVDRHQTPRVVYSQPPQRIVTYYQHTPGYAPVPVQYAVQPPQPPQHAIQVGVFTQRVPNTPTHVLRPTQTGAYTQRAPNLHTQTRRPVQQVPQTQLAQTTPKPVPKRNPVITDSIKKLSTHQHFVGKNRLLRSVSMSVIQSYTRNKNTSYSANDFMNKVVSLVKPVRHTFFDCLPTLTVSGSIVQHKGKNANTPISFENGIALSFNKDLIEARMSGLLENFTDFEMGCDAVYMLTHFAYTGILPQLNFNTRSKWQAFRYGLTKDQPLLSYVLMASLFGTDLAGITHHISDLQDICDSSVVKTKTREVKIEGNNLEYANFLASHFTKKLREAFVGNQPLETQRLSHRVTIRILSNQVSTPKPMIPPVSKFASDMNNFMLKNDGDITIVYNQDGTDTQKLHSSILSTSCDFFNGVPANHPIQACGWTNDPENITPSQIAISKQFIKYLYTGECNITPENAVELLIAASYFLLDKKNGLWKQCTYHIVENMNLENSFAIEKLLLFDEEYREETDVIKQAIRFEQSRVVKVD